MIVTGVNGLDIRMTQDTLLRCIQRHAKDAMAARQVAKRLESLLPRRLKEIERGYRSQVVPVRSAPVAQAQRNALCDPSYIEFVEEFLKLSGDALHGRIQYETHLMLFEARRSLRKASRQR